MNDGHREAWRRTRRQAFLYALVGGAQLCSDWACFVLLTWLGLDVVWANVGSRLLGAILGFWLNGRITFGRAGAVLSHAQAIRFATSWSAMTLLGSAALKAIEQSLGLPAARLGKPLLDAILAAFGFLLSKYWIYR